MKLTINHMNASVTKGHMIELWDDMSHAQVKLYCEAGYSVLLSGIPTELRKLARSILNGLTKRRKEKNKMDVMYNGGTGYTDDKEIPVTENNETNEKGTE